MTQVLITESYLEDIADAIREKSGSESTYTPAQMATAIENIPSAGEPDLVTKAIVANGTYAAEDDGHDGYSQVAVQVPNSYAASDEGKVVSNGALVAQTGTSIFVNGTYDTTLNDEVVVNVSGGGSNAFMEYDFTKLSGTIRNVQYGSTGAVFSDTRCCIGLYTPKINDITIEIDIASMQLTSGTHRRLLMPFYNEGLIYRSTGVWACYFNSTWVESNVTDASYLDNAILKVYIDDQNLWHFYKNGVLFFEPSGARSLSTSNTDYGRIMLGSYDGSSINNATIRGVKIYNGEHIS